MTRKSIGIRPKGKMKYLGGLTTLFSFNNAVQRDRRNLYVDGRKLYSYYQPDQTPVTDYGQPIGYVKNLANERLGRVEGNAVYSKDMSPLDLNFGYVYVEDNTPVHVFIHTDEQVQYHRSDVDTATELRVQISIHSDYALMYLFGNYSTKEIEQIKNTLVLNGNTVVPEFSPKHLFLNGEQGFYVDPANLDTLYQDALMQQKVTANDQTVQRIEPVNSRNIWQKLDLLVTEFVSVPIGGSAYNQVRIHNSIKAGQRYKLKFKVRNYEGTGNTGYVNSSFRLTSDAISSATVDGNGSYELDAIGHTAGYATLYTRDTNQAEFYDIEIYEYSDLQAYQYTASQRPIYRDGYIEFDGIDDFLQLPVFALPYPYTVVVAFESIKKAGTQALFSSGVGGYLYTSNPNSVTTQQLSSNPIIIQPKDIKDVVTHSNDGEVITLKTNVGSISSTELVANNPYSSSTSKFIGSFSASSIANAGIKLYAMLVINRALTDEEEAAVRKLFNKKMGVV